MLNDCINVGHVPAEESCAQVGSTEYLQRSARESTVFKRMLERLFPVPDGVPAVIAASTFPYDFGAYCEVCVKFDRHCAKAADYAYAIENDAPTRWDAIAKYELAWHERRDSLRRAFGAGELPASELAPQFALDRLPALDAGATFSELLERHPL